MATSLLGGLQARPGRYIYSIVVKVNPLIRSTITLIKRNRGHVISILLLLVVAGVIHATNMYNYPYYENDEGTYLSRGWSLVTDMRLDPYTFWYDHVPFASFMLGLWILISGGLERFEMAVDSGRLFMLFIHLFNVVLMYYIGVRMTGRKLMGVIAALVFSLSPLGIYFYRRVLLDNLIAFWLLVTVAIVVKDRLTIRWVLISAVTFAFGVLTKENVVLFIPFFIYAISTRTKGVRRFLGVSNWLILAGGVISLYFFYAIFKGEFFPPGTLGTPEDSVSLMHTLQFHLGRGNGLPFWDTQSDFYGNYLDWMGRDSLVIYVGAVSTLMLIPLSLKNLYARYLLIISLIHAWFLMRGSLILNFYIISVLPFIALNIGYVVDQLVALTRRRSIFVSKYVAYYSITIILILFMIGPKDPFIRDENVAFRESVDWALENLNGDEFVVIDNAIYLDLKIRDKRFENAEWFWKVDNDPEVYEDKLKGEWSNINYILLSHEIVKQVASQQFVFIQNSIENADLLGSWEKGTTSYIDLENYISTNGDWGRVYKVPNKNELIARKSWDHMKQKFIISYGQIYDEVSQQTTSYMQSNWMLLSYLANDQDTFDSVYAWANDHFNYRQEDALLSRTWFQEDADVEEGSVIETASSSRADIQYTGALILAYEKWGNERYLERAKQMMDSIWETEILELRGRYYVLEGSDSYIFDPVTSSVNTFYVDPYAALPSYLELFMKYDEEREWDFVLEDWNSLIYEQFATFDSGVPLLPQRLLLSLDGSLVIDKEVEPTDTSNFMLVHAISTCSEEERNILLAMDQEIEDGETPNSPSYVVPLLSSFYAQIGTPTVDPNDPYLKILSKGINFTTGEWNGISDKVDHIGTFLISDLRRL